jgi:hypothetical protein
VIHSGRPRCDCHRWHKFNPGREWRCPHGTWRIVGIALSVKFPTDVCTWQRVLDNEEAT